MISLQPASLQHFLVLPLKRINNEKMLENFFPDFFSPFFPPPEHDSPSFSSYFFRLPNTKHQKYVQKLFLSSSCLLLLTSNLVASLSCYRNRFSFMSLRSFGCFLLKSCCKPVAESGRGERPMSEFATQKTYENPFNPILRGGICLAIVWR